MCFVTPSFTLLHQMQLCVLLHCLGATPRVMHEWRRFDSFVFVMDDLVQPDMLLAAGKVEPITKTLHCCAIAGV